MDVPTPPSGPLAQPTRARVFALLAELRRQATTDELAERLGLHPNGVRVHLDRLHDAGLVRRDRERGSRGRPRDLWTISADARPAGERPTGYAELARWLVRSLTATGAAVDDVEAAGRRIGRDLAASADGGIAGERRMHDALVALGFQPARERRGGDQLAYRLRNCPYREAVRERQPLVCGLHRGITQGMLDAIDPATRLAGFVPRDPDAAGCLIELRGPLAAAPDRRRARPREA